MWEDLLEPFAVELELVAELVPFAAEGAVLEVWLEAAGCV